MKKFIFFISLMGLLPFFNSCSVGYVSEVPVYQVYVRPQQPRGDYVWIEGGWTWNNRTKTYVQVDGTWVRHEQGRKHRTGHWEKNEHGSRWVKNR